MPFNVMDKPLPRKVLVVDDEKNILKSVYRLLAGTNMDVLTAGSGEEALGCLAENEIAVLLTDNRMAGLTGLDLLKRVKVLAPDTVRMLMTAYGDYSVAVQAINEGEVYKFIVKPWDNDQLVRGIVEGVDRYEVVRALRHSDEATLLSLAQTIELKDSYTRGHCERVAGYALLLTEALQFAPALQKDIKFGSWLHDCGKIGVPEGILNKPGRFDAKEREIVNNHPVWGAEVASLAGLSAVVVNAIRHHHEKYDGSGYPGGLAGEDIPLEARIVAVADVFDALSTDRPYRSGFSVAKSLAILREESGKFFDPHLVNIFADLMLKQQGKPGE